MNFGNAIDEQNSVSQNESQTSVASLMVGRPVKTKQGNWINVETCSKTIGPNQKFSVEIKLDCVNQESIEEFFEVLVRDSRPLFF